MLFQNIVFFSGCNSLVVEIGTVLQCICISMTIPNVELSSAVFVYDLVSFCAFSFCSSVMITSAVCIHCEIVGCDYVL